MTGKIDLQHQCITYFLKYELSNSNKYQICKFQKDIHYSQMQIFLQAWLQHSFRALIQKLIQKNVLALAAKIAPALRHFHLHGLHRAKQNKIKVKWWAKFQFIINDKEKKYMTKSMKNNAFAYTKRWHQIIFNDKVYISC